jgi:16S rRNA (uracil1498-N3)-methyltransferase
VLVAVNEIAAEPLGTTPLALITAACKGDRFDYMIEKCTELGVEHVVLADFERSVVRAGPQHLARAGQTALAACKQCRRANLPEFHVAASLAAAATTVTGSHPAVDSQAPVRLLLAHLDPAAPLLVEHLQADPPTGATAVIIGPEGGITPEELAGMQQRGAGVVRLAQYTLRVETAAIATAAQWAGVMRR